MDFMKLILTRHGETVENKKGIRQGQLLDGQLTELGIEQAKKLALRLKDEKVDAIYSSDLGRSFETAQIILKYHPDKKFYVTKDLREIDLGSFAGKTIEETPIDWKNCPKDIETWENMIKRSKRVLEKAYKKYPRGCVIFVSHGGINRAMVCAILNKPITYVLKLKREDNTAVSIFNIKQDKNHEAELIYCTKHLD